VCPVLSFGQCGSHADVPFRPYRVVFLLLLGLSSMIIDSLIQLIVVVSFFYFAQSRFHLVFNIMGSSPSLFCFRKKILIPCCTSFILQILVFRN
jgi:hypothetical protein